MHESLCSKFSDETEVSLDRVYWERKVADQARAKELPQRRAALLEGLATHRNAPLSQLQSLSATEELAAELATRMDAVLRGRLPCTSLDGWVHPLLLRLRHLRKYQSVEFQEVAESVRGFQRL